MVMRFYLKYVSVFFTILFVSSNCTSNKKIHKAYTKNECESYRPKFDYYKIKSGNIIADVGAGNGWSEGVFSGMSDSVKFYIQDINTRVLNQDELNKIVKHYSSIKLSPQTNSFYMVIGSEKKTNLPNGLFNKIIIHNTFHEFTDPKSLVQDLTTKVKPNGEIFVSDQFSSDYRKIKHQGC